MLKTNQRDQFIQGAILRGKEFDLIASIAVVGYSQYYKEARLFWASQSVEQRDSIINEVKRGLGK